MKVVSFLASHGGSSAKKIIEATEAGVLNARIGVIITNNKNSEIYEWCIENNIPVAHISGNTHPDELLKDLAIKFALEEAKTDIVVLSGYMKKIGSATLNRFNGKILNIHPSLLPKHGGKGLYGDRVHRSVLESGDEVSGATVQIINEEYDEGPIVFQKSVPVLRGDTIESLKSRVQGIEGELYIQAIASLTQ
ncbi:phosphoribosylglycinamide formyltransferase [Gilvimarinus sp. DA14]|uniref:phosphoribosylglycinamide formyltransferase n=1 Tax=Gilvimarinus sp. DA14 TaxID=2956798 RepID=UPI0020B7F4C2|nr:phosphoribosylglycinamide formyltransferase [Gilvimarinus sp. DA14]UTF60902.1 phosphoribosylglycinamide formyltransferase [Gilvimarinus sp. DA14]